MKTSKLRLATPLIALFAMAFNAGCASDPAKRAEVAAKEVARYDATSVPLSTFGKFDLKLMALDDAVAADAKKVEVAQELDAKLNARLTPLLESFDADQIGVGGPTLEIVPKVVGLRVVSGGARFWAGGMAGSSFIDMDLHLIDTSTGALVGKPRIRREADGMAGGWSVGATDRNLLDYIVDIAHRYLEENYTPASTN